MRHCSIHIFWTPISLSDLFFLGKPAWTLKSDGWIRNCTTQVVKMWIQLSNLLHGVGCFVAFGNRIRSCTYGITLVRWHIFHFCCIMIRITHIESWLKTTHYLFKAKQQWASLNKHYLSYTYLFVDFYCKSMFICRQLTYSRFKNKW